MPTHQDRIIKNLEEQIAALQAENAALAAANPTAVDKLIEDVYEATINKKANACPMMMRLAWHASGTWDKNDKSGGSDGASMRFAPESTDDANAGIGIPRSMLKEVKKKNPEFSIADIWCAAGCSAVEFAGGPNVPVSLGRTDISESEKYAIPPNGRLPDAAQGAAHLRDVFYRQGFNDQEIVALSGAHTMGSCHMVRSGFDGPWTTQPLKFDNEYFRNLVNKKWKVRDWDGPKQYQDEETGVLMMLPTDMCMMEDESFRPWVEKYANDEALFFEHFASAFAKLVANGTEDKAKTPAKSGVGAQKAKENPFLKPKDPYSHSEEDPSARFRDAAMHGQFEKLTTWSKAAGVDVLAAEASSGRSALHKGAFWGHEHEMDFLLAECGLAKIVDLRDFAGDTALHDAARFGHVGVVRKLLGVGGADASVRNGEGADALAVAREVEEWETVKILEAHAATAAKKL